MKLSVVIPAYQEEKRIRKTLSRLVSYLNRHSRSYEIIVVDDGSQDQTHAILLDAAKQYSALKVIRNETNHGKGYAVKQGILSAGGDLIFFTDADLSTPPREITKFVEIFEDKKIDILIGSRNIRGAKIKIQQPYHRQLMGRVFNMCVRLLTRFPFYDTQCGFKAFRKSAARKIFSKVKQNGFNFDIETLFLAKKFGYQVREVPVIWVNNQSSKISALSDSVKMFLGLISLRQEHRNL